MNIFIYVADCSDIKIWGLTGRERLLRLCSRIDNTKIITAIDQVPETAPVLILRSDYLIDPRILTAAAGRNGEFAIAAGERVIAIVRVTGKDARVHLQNLQQGNDDAIRANLPVITPEDMNINYQDNLKKNDPPYFYSVTADNRSRLENLLYDSVYKGVTDLITKWLWPLPARWATRICVHTGVNPNHLTLTGLLLAVLAAVEFWLGSYGPGLLCAWIMTFLDTVDGKLARVTVTSSRMGHILDHGMDIIHPPIWYMAWGFGLGTGLIVDTVFAPLLWLMLAAYLGGRVCEILFEILVAPFSIFVWRPLDSFNRLITARRNPNLILLSTSWLWGRPELGLWAVVLWHTVSTVLLGVRLLQGLVQKHRAGPLQTWLNEIDPAGDRTSLAVRVFTKVSEQD